VVDQESRGGRATCGAFHSRTVERVCIFRQRCEQRFHPASVVRSRRFWPSGACGNDVSFRTPREAVELANNTVLRLAPVVEREHNVSLHVKDRSSKAGVVWVNLHEILCECTPAGFWGYSESGMDAGGGAMGFSNISSMNGLRMLPPVHTTPLAIDQPPEGTSRLLTAPAIDRTVKLSSAANRRGMIQVTASLESCARRDGRCLG